MRGAAGFLGALGLLTGAVAPYTAAFAQEAVPKQVAGSVQTNVMKFSKAAEAWGGILADRKALGEIIKTGKLSEAHEIAFAIRDAVVTLPYKSGALTADKKKALQTQVAQVASIAENIDKYADAGSAAKTKAEYARLTKSLNAIEKLYPADALPTAGAKPMTMAEREIFLKPGGLYTQADIEANGNTSVYQKFPSFIADHEQKVAVSDPVCPISGTKPNPQLTWIISGKKYTFCCPPCVTEFVKKSKANPKAILAPEEYVKK